MASIKDLKKRIVTVKNTQQTTRAMKMVSAAKLRRAQDAIYNHRAYAQAFADLLQTVRGQMGEKLVLSPYIQPRANAQKRLLCLLVTSDRGLCGAFNQSVSKACQRWMIEIQQASSIQSIELCFSGKKGLEYFKKRHSLLGPLYADFSGRVSPVKARQLSQILLKRYLSGEVDEVYVVYNQFKNAMTQFPCVEQFLPLSIPIAPEEKVGEAVALNSSFQSSLVKECLFEPSLDVIFEKLVEQYFEIHLLRVFLDSQAGEHGARMAAMESATKNAGEMIRKLTLEYNKQRQAGITKELLEIIAGSESQK